MLSKFTELLEATEVRKIEYKGKQYHLDNVILKSEFIIDILCIANAPGEDGYILIGVKSEKGKPHEVVGISEHEHYDSASLEQIVNSKIVEPIHFDYYPLKYKGLDCALIHIPQSHSRPHWSRKDFGKLKQRVLYTRRASGNRQASIPEIREMFLSSIPISDMPHRKARTTGHIVDELIDMDMDDRSLAMYQMLKDIAKQIHLYNYKLLRPSYVSKPICALVTSRSSKKANEYAVFMHPWTAKLDNIIRARSHIESIIDGARSSELKSADRARIKNTSLIHISYRSIHTKALERRNYWYSLFYSRFANEWKESWGKVMKWEIISYLQRGTKESQYEFFLQNISSKEELCDCLKNLLIWADANIT